MFIKVINRKSNVCNLDIRYVKEFYAEIGEGDDDTLEFFSVFVTEDGSFYRSAGLPIEEYIEYHLALNISCDAFNIKKYESQRLLKEYLTEKLVDILLREMRYIENIDKMLHCILIRDIERKSLTTYVADHLGIDPVDFEEII